MTERMSCLGLTGRGEGGLDGFFGVFGLEEGGKMIGKW